MGVDIYFLLMSLGLTFTLFWLISLMGGVDIYLVLAHQFNGGVDIYLVLAHQFDRIDIYLVLTHQFDGG